MSAAASVAPVREKRMEGDVTLAAEQTKMASEMELTDVGAVVFLLVEDSTAINPSGNVACEE